ncbi:MAG: hypothetical protein CUN55_01975 [Phototrophicales bacterium]|nr:MAG: hypothetical protein CUN55_01975 [Phototrophicales bacterium]
MNRFLTIFVLICLIIGGILVPTHTPTFAQDSENLLTNPGFEGEFIAIGGDNTLRVAEGWQPWHLPPPPNSDGSTNLRPDYQPAPPTRVRSGDAAQQYDTFFATHTGGIYQQVTLPQTGTVTFSVWVYPYSSLSFEDINQSIDPQGLEVSVGIDPNGGTDGDSNTIIWSEPVEYYDEYRELTVSTTAAGTTITVFVRSTVEGAAGLHQVFVDDASLTLVPGEGPAPESTATVVTETPEVTTTSEPVQTEETATSVATTPAPSDVTATTPPPATTPAPQVDDGSEPTAVARGPFSAELPNQVVYVVQPGDTIGSIAQRFASDPEAIIEYNGLNENGLIFINQTLLVPVPEGAGEPVPEGQGGSVDVEGGAGGGPDTQVTTGEQVVVVQPGDNLFRIALRYNLTVETLARYNNILNPAYIQVGQEIRIPPTTTVPSSTPAPATPIVGQPMPPSTGNYIIHVVQPGENIFRIGLRYNLTWDVIARANGLVNPNVIFVGQQLIIPR